MQKTINWKDVAQRISYQRNFVKFMTTAEVSKASGLSLSTITNLENESHKPQYETLRKASKALGVSVNYLLTGEK